MRGMHDKSEGVRWCDGLVEDKYPYRQAPHRKGLSLRPNRTKPAVSRTVHPITSRHISSATILLLQQIIGKDGFYIFWPYPNHKLPLSSITLILAPHPRSTPISVLHCTKETLRAGAPHRPMTY